MLMLKIEKSPWAQHCNQWVIYSVDEAGTREGAELAAQRRGLYRTRAEAVEARERLENEYAQG